MFALPFIAVVIALFCTALVDVVERLVSIVIVLGSPLSPFSPFSPCGPCGPVAPVSPFGPAGPCGPVAPVSPFGPIPEPKSDSTSNSPPYHKSNAHQ